MATLRGKFETFFIVLRLKLDGKKSLDFGGINKIAKKLFRE
jgi:hypothetical protein